MLLMHLERIRHATTPSVLAHACGISQSSVSRYSDYVEAFLGKNLPTGDDLAERINRARPAGPTRRCHATGSCATARTFRGRSPKTRTKERRPEAVVLTPAKRPLVAVAGLVNMHRLTHGHDKSRNYRKGKKPEPKTAHSR